MTGRTLLFVACLLSGTLAGCLGTAGEENRPTDAQAQRPDDQGPGAGSAARTNLSLTACAAQGAYFTIPASQAEPYLPNGFEPVTIEGVPVHEGTASLILHTIACPDPDGGEDLVQTWVTLGVDPPEAYSLEAAAYHFLFVAGVTQSPEIRSTLEAWGIPQLHPGEVVFDTEQATPLASTQRTVAEHEGRGLSFTTTAAVRVELEYTVTRVFGADDGDVTGIVDVAFPGDGEDLGDADVQDGSLIPFDLNEPGVGSFATDVDYTFTPAPLPGSDAATDRSDREGST